MKRTLAVISTASAFALAVAGAGAAAPPEPAPDHPNCHGLAMAHGSMGVGAGNYAKAAGISTVDAHYVFMALKGCH